MPYEKVGKNEPVCIADEVPFDIPDSWEWVRLKNITVKEIKRGKSPKYSDSGSVYVFAQKCNVKTGGIDISIAKFLDIKTFEKYPTEEYMVDEDIIINSTGNGTLGRIGIFHDTDRINDFIIVPDSHVTIVRVCDQLKTDYLFYTLKYYQPFLEKLGEGSTNQTELRPSTVAELLIPIPPINEQKQIVAKLLEVMPMVDVYGEKEKTLQAYNTDFPTLLKKSILQEAVQGKLVPQDPDDEPASVLLECIRAEKEHLIKAGKIKRDKHETVIFRRDNSHYEKRGSEEVCIDEELPFEIPSSWEWSRLSSLAYNIFAGGDKPKDFTKKATVENKFPVIANGITNDGILGYTSKPTAPANTITVAGRGTIGFSLYRTYAYCPIVRLIVIEQCHGINPQYLQYVLEAFPKKSLGTSIPQLTVPMLKPKLIPVPPLSEQNRIVKQIDKLLSTVKLL